MHQLTWQGGGGLQALVARDTAPLQHRAWVLLQVCELALEVLQGAGVLETRGQDAFLAQVVGLQAGQERKQSGQ
jgi:hypothetical protein